MLFAQIEWINFLREFGLPLFELAIVVWGLVRVIQWSARELLIPFRDKLLVRAVDFFNSLDAMILNIQKVVTTQSEKVAHLEVSHEEMKAVLLQLVHRLDGRELECSKMHEFMKIKFIEREKPS